MFKEWKEKWLNALRSGEYTQEREYLQCNGGYCCLGVLGDLAVEDGAAEWSTSRVEDERYEPVILMSALKKDDYAEDVLFPSLMEHVGSYNLRHDGEIGVDTDVFESIMNTELKDGVPQGILSLVDKEDGDSIDDVFEHFKWEVQHINSRKATSLQKTKARISLVELNDAGVSFKTIANIIEKFVKETPVPVAEPEEA